MKAQHYTKETIAEIGVQCTTIPKFSVGDTIKVSQRVKEMIKKDGQEILKERLQIFEGDVIAIKHGSGISGMFTVRKMSANNVNVERIFPYHTPLIESITVVKRGKVRRAKLYYLRDRVGKAARIRERVLTKEQKSLAASKSA